MMADAGDFIRRTNHLMDEVGDGPLVMGCGVDQIYAQNQHETESFRHTRGRSHYLSGPLMENSFNFVDGLSRAAVTESGSSLREEAIGIADDLNRLVKINAPKDPDFGDELANSGSPYVIDNGDMIYHRPPKAPRSYDHK